MIQRDLSNTREAVELTVTGSSTFALLPTLISICLCRLLTNKNKLTYKFNNSELFICLGFFYKV